jgi:hypothetical protein
MKLFLLTLSRKPRTLSPLLLRRLAEIFRTSPASLFKPVRMNESHPSHELQNVRILRQIRDTILSQQISNLMSDGSTKPQILLKNQRFLRNFHFFRIKYPDICQEGVYDALILIRKRRFCVNVFNVHCAPLVPRVSMLPEKKEAYTIFTKHRPRITCTCVAAGTSDINLLYQSC